MHVEKAQRIKALEFASFFPLLHYFLNDSTSGTENKNKVLL